MHINGTTAWRRAIPIRVSEPWKRRFATAAVPVALFLSALLFLVVLAADIGNANLQLVTVFVFAFGLGILLRSCWPAPASWLAVWGGHPGLNAAVRRLRVAIDDGADQRSIAGLIAESMVDVTKGSACELTLSDGARILAGPLGLQWLTPSPLAGLPAQDHAHPTTIAPLRTELVALGEELATVEVWPRSGRRFGRKEEELLSLLSVEAAVALKNALLMEAAHRQEDVLASKISESEWWQSQLGEYANSLERTHQELSQTRSTLEETYMATLETLANAVDAKDPNTYGHCRRVAELASMLAIELGIPEGDRQVLERVALLHDIGKLGIPDSTLRKLTPLNGDDATAIQQHPELGYRMLSGLRFLADGLSAIRYHHERFDGTGYPYRLAGEQIPLLARILAVADAYDAITSDRPYRSGRPSGQGVAEIVRCAGTHFDPTVVAAFVRALGQAA
ncbi:MAG: HD-GYP domain-containing protein [Chloroflexota bacterium]